MTTATIQTGADQATAELAKKLTAAGWKVAVTAHDGDRTTFSSGRLMIPRSRHAWVDADGPKTIGAPYLHVYWTTVIEETDDPEEGDRLGDTQLNLASVTFNRANSRELHSEPELATWVDALTTVTAALDAT